MGTAGLQVAMSVLAPGSCPAGEISAETGDEVSNISWNAATGEGPVTEEFTADSEIDREGVTPVFETHTETRYRFERERDRSCVCEAVERRDCPLQDVRAENGRLVLTFYAPDVDVVRSLVADLRAQYGDVQLQHLSRSGDLDSENLVLVDRGRLTERQREVIETAYEMGYFEHPRETNGSEIAETLDISLSTFTEHLTIAQSKVLDALVGTN
ncbi:helix-turn-helix domain-containing protein [Halorientalis salina]|uniref:helix-turn-helix domain-containing protein n=1 Tax=Halorientalis salina TaxID=2932266 RepID=UPI0010AB5069|nr:helix-turn-helix domain-containing protein [Halorientalis salina]